MTTRRQAIVMAVAAGVTAAGVAWSTPTQANGAFPDSQNILTPSDRPDEIVLATNFGLMISEDGGQTWSWSCEQPTSNNGHLYQLGPGPAHRLFGLALGNLIYSRDLACSWSVAGGMLAGFTVPDYFPDPSPSPSSSSSSSADRVVAVANQTVAGVASSMVVESTDGGATFTNVIFQAAAGDTVTGLEIARSDPQTIYLALTSNVSLPPKLARSADGGGSWQTFDLGSALTGNGELRILAVDPDDAGKVFLRWNVSGGDSLLLVENGGASLQAPLPLGGGTMTAFTRMESGAVLMGASVAASPVLFRSTDGGVTFEQLTGGPHLRALSARGGVLFGVGDNVNDHYAVATSQDQGTTWQPLMQYAQVQGISACVAVQCLGGCQVESGLGLWNASVCAATVAEPATDGGDGGAGGGIDGGDAGDMGGAGGTRMGTGGSGGCHCGVADARPAAGVWALGLAWLLVKRRRPSPAPRSRPIS